MSLITLIVCAATSAFAAPTQLGHQGRLLDVDGIPLEGLHSLEFEIYDSIEEGTVLWSEVHDVELINGYYSLVLGADELDNPLEDSLFEEDELYLELTIDEDEELEPRQALNAVPYARIAGQATNVKGGVVDASEIRVGGATVVDSSGTWVSSTPAVDWSELTGIPAPFADGEDAVLTESEVDAFIEDNGYARVEDLDWSELTGIPAPFADGEDAVLTESEVDAFIEDNGYAKVEDLEEGSLSISYDDLVDVPASISAGSIGIQAQHLTGEEMFVVPDGITSLIVYITGGGGGGVNGETTLLDGESHSHNVASHSHGGGDHSHSTSSHTHTSTHSHSTTGYGCSYTSHGGGCGATTTTTGGTTVTTTDGSGASDSSDIGTTAGASLTTNDAGGGGGSITVVGGSGGSGGGMSAILSVTPGEYCEYVIGDGGAIAESGATTTFTCATDSVSCSGGLAGDTTGLAGIDGSCTSTGTVLTEYKASCNAPGGGGSGGQFGGAANGQAGSLTVRY